MESLIPKKMWTMLVQISELIQGILGWRVTLDRCFQMRLALRLSVLLAF